MVLCPLPMESKMLLLLYESLHYTGKLCSETKEIQLGLRQKKNRTNPSLILLSVDQKINWTVQPENQYNTFI